MIYSKYLKENRVADPEKITINGGSNGGLLVAACLNVAPQGTFGAAIADVGVLDMLKVKNNILTRKVYFIDGSLVQQIHDWTSLGLRLWQPR